MALQSTTWYKISRTIYYNSSKLSWQLQHLIDTDDRICVHAPIN